MAAVEFYEKKGGTASIFVNDDGMQLVKPDLAEYVTMMLLFAKPLANSISELEKRSTTSMELAGALVHRTAKLRVTTTSSAKVNSRRPPT
jgi:hypothetical protein